MSDLWEEVGNKCLKRASEMLDEKTITPERAGVIGELTKTAIWIDELNLRWEEKNRSCAAVYSRLACGQKSKAD